LPPSTARSRGCLVSDRWFVRVAIFLLIYIVSYVDRQILSIVVGPVKASLHLGDFEIGLLQGFAFSLVLALAAVLTAPLVDRSSRVRAIGVCMMVWCSMTIACGFAPNFISLLVARTGLALAEAIVPMAALSIICDIVPRATVPRASALFLAAPYLGSGCALLLGGPLLAFLGQYAGRPLPVVGPFEPWRGLFWLLGGPGLVLGGLVLVLLREPARQLAHAADKTATSALAFLGANLRFFGTLVVFTAMLTMTSFTIYAWMPTYMIRVQGMAPANAGVSVGTVFVLAGVCGCVFGSWIMSRSTAERALSHVVRTILQISLCLWPPLILMPFAPNANLALVLLFVVFFLMAAALSSVMTPVSLFAPPLQRGRLLATAGLVNCVLGGLGPLSVGALNDFVLKSSAHIDRSLSITFAGACLIAVLTGPLAASMARRIDDEGALAARSPILATGRT
jgi:MFS family permease